MKFLCLYKPAKGKLLATEGCMPSASRVNRQNLCNRGDTMQVNTYLNFNGQCEAAFQFYEQHLGGEIQFKLTYGDSPMADNMPAEWRGKLIHAALKLGNQVIQGCDAPADHFKQPSGFFVSLSVKDATEAERVFGALAENGTVTMPLQQTFWSPKFGMLVDQFGIPWMVNTEVAPA
jgi:PhnB protein